MPNDEKPPTQRGAERRDDEQRDRDRVDRSVDGRDEDAEQTGHDTVDSTQFAPARQSGEKPSRTAPFSFSAAARVASPKRVKRNSAHRTTASSDHEPATSSWSWGMAMPRGNVTGSLARIGLTGRGVRAEAQDDDRLEHEQQADRRHHLGQRRRVAQRPEDQKWKSRPSTDAHDQGDDQRGRRRSAARRARAASASRQVDAIGVPRAGGRRPRRAPAGSAAAGGTARPRAAARRTT